MNTFWNISFSDEGENTFYKPTVIYSNTTWYSSANKRKQKQEKKYVQVSISSNLKIKKV